MMRIPPRPVFWATLRTTLLAWLVLRAIVAFSSGSPSVLLPTSVFLMLAVAAVAVVDITVSRERLLLGNLGVGRRVIAGVSLLVSGALELVSAIAVQGLGLGS